MQYSIVGGSLPAVVIQMNPGETIVSEVGGRTWARGPVPTETKGGIVARELGPGESAICQKSAFLCATLGVGLSVHLQKKIGAGLFGGDGFIMQKVTGPGLVLFEFDGYCPAYDLTPGEKLVCDTGVVAMMDATCQLDIQMVKGLKNKLLGGEGLIDTVVTGPGKVYLQTMSLTRLAQLLTPLLPFKPE